MIDIWRSLAEGPPIDEQRTLRQTTVQLENTQLTTSKGDVVLTLEDSDDEGRDPYKSGPVAFGPSGDPYEDLEDDDDEY